MDSVFVMLLIGAFLFVVSFFYLFTNWLKVWLKAEIIRQSCKFYQQELVSRHDEL